MHNLQITNIDPVKRDRVVSLRCSPGKFVDLVKATPDEIKDRLRAMGFGGLLEFKPTSLPRMLLIWLMDKFNPESMSLELGMGKVIEINEHAVWCMFMLNRVGNDPPNMDMVEAREMRNSLSLQVHGVTGNKILPKVIKEKIQFRTLQGDVAVRCWLMHAFCTLLFANTDNYIRLDDIIWTADVRCISGINWCKAVVDDLRHAARLYRHESFVKGKIAPINGCGIFLVVSYLIILFFSSFYPHS